MQIALSLDLFNSLRFVIIFFLLYKWFICIENVWKCRKAQRWKYKSLIIPSHRDNDSVAKGFDESFHVTLQKTFSSNISTNIWSQFFTKFEQPGPSQHFTWWTAYQCSHYKQLSLPWQRYVLKNRMWRGAEVLSTCTEQKCVFCSYNFEKA